MIDTYRPDIAKTKKIGRRRDLAVHEAASARRKAAKAAAEAGHDGWLATATSTQGYAANQANDLGAAC